VLCPEYELPNPWAFTGILKRIPGIPSMESPMSVTRRFAPIFALALAAVMLASCADDHAPPTGPSAPVAPIQPDPALLGDLVDGVTGTLGSVVNSLGLVRCNVRMTHTASAEIGPAGGLLRVGPHLLSVPPKALTQKVRISAVAPKGQYVQIQFYPQGLKFARPTLLTMSYAECSLLSPLRLKIVYADDNFKILEVLPTLVSLLTRTANAPVDHFSRYMLAD
jgi:hypothetical protein